MRDSGNVILKPEESVVLRLRKLYREYGYLHYKVGKFEEYDLYMQNKNFLPDGNILTFTDTDGRLMALKPDITLSIVKNAGTRNSGMQKLCYNENVYRTNGGGFREIMQSGLECIGDLDAYTVCETVMLAYKSLECFNEDFLLDLSHMGFVSALLEEARAGDSVNAGLTAALGEKNRAEIKRICDGAGIGKEMCERLCETATLYGEPGEVMPVLDELACNAASRSAVGELKEIFGTLHAVGDYANLRLDFSLVNDRNYYNGIIFQGFLKGIPKRILAGGRYDELMRKMGNLRGAIGFAVYLDGITGRGTPDYDVDILLEYEPGTPPDEIAAKVKELRERGKTVRCERAGDTEVRYREKICMRAGENVVANG